MDGKLRQAMSVDMNIRPFTDEPEKYFNQRIIYSAGAEWVKKLVFGRSYADIGKNFDYVYVDILYVKYYLSEILEGFLHVFDVNESWLPKNLSIEEKAKCLSSQIVKEIVHTYNMAEIDSRSLTPVKSELFKYGKKEYLARGQQTFDKDIYNVGVAKWLITDSPIQDYKRDTRIIDVDVAEYYKVLENQADWHSADLNPSLKYLIFNVGQKDKYWKCWKYCDLLNLPNGISMVKVDDKLNGGYFLIKKEHEKILVANLDCWYWKEREINRILYALNYNNGTPATFRAKKYNDFYELTYGTLLPNFEDRIIKSCSWPAYTYDRFFQRIVPSFLWDVVKNTLEYLKINILYS